MDNTRKTATRVHMALGIGRVTNEVIFDQNTPTVQATFAGSEVRDQIPLMQQYGFASSPVPGADVVASFQSGDHNKGVVIATNDQRYRIKTLKSGEVAIYHKSGSAVILKDDGSIEINPKKDQQTIINSDVQVNGKVNATGNIETSSDVKAGSISLKSHEHPKGHDGQPTGAPTS